MDGSSPTELVTGLNGPYGITIDFKESRLYWVTGASGKVQSSDMHGQDIKTILQSQSNAWPRGVGLLGSRIYWTSFEDEGGQFESSDKSGKDIKLLHNDTNAHYHIAPVPRLDLPTSRTNHCENQSCSKVCVLTPTSYKCVS